MKQGKSHDWYDKYATKKTFSNGLMDGALLATNAAQLRTLLTTGFYNKEDPKWYISISLVATSLCCQIIMLILCGVLANNNLTDRNKSTYLNVINNIVLVLTGIIFCLNIIVNVFVQIDFTNLININTTKPSGFESIIPFNFWSSSAPSV